MVVLVALRKEKREFLYFLGTILRYDDLIDLQGFVKLALPQVVLNRILTVILNCEFPLFLAHKPLLHYLGDIQVHVLLLTQRGLFDQHASGIVKLKLFEQHDEGCDLYEECFTNSFLRSSWTLCMIRINFCI
jgi:hypothetical protein